MQTVSMNVNGESISGEVEDRMLLVEFLREHLRLTGTHVGCDTSQCGACVVHVNGVSVKSCTTLAVQAEGGDVTTIEGLAINGELHPMQQAFKDNHGLLAPLHIAVIRCVRENAAPRRVEAAQSKLAPALNCT